MRLIDADHVLYLLKVSRECRKKIHRNTSDLDVFIKIIREEPTAYNVGEVIKELNLCIESSMNGANNIECAYWNKGIERAIEIVEGGGVDGYK